MNHTPDTPRPAASVARPLIAGLAALGLIGSAFLLVQSLAAGPALPGCGPGSGCDQVMTSPFAYWFGLPVAAPALLVYAILLAALAHLGPSASPRRRHFASATLLFAATLLIGAALWFSAVQWLILDAFCRWCLAVHAVGLLTGLTILLQFTTPLGLPTHLRPFSAASTSALALVLLAGFAFAQFAFPHQPRQAMVDSAFLDDTGPGPDRTLTILVAGQLEMPVHTHDYPTLGSPDAAHILVYFFDYTCLHCRQVHRYLDHARDRFGDELGIVMFPVPLAADCNPVIDQTPPAHEHACALASLAMALWQHHPEHFEAFDRYLTTDPEPPHPDDAAAFAAELVGEQALAAALEDPWPGEQLARNGQLVDMPGFQYLPQIVAPHGRIAGQPPSLDVFYEDLAALTDLNIPPASDSDELAGEQPAASLVPAPENAAQ